MAGKSAAVASRMRMSTMLSSAPHDPADKPLTLAAYDAGRRRSPTSNRRVGDLLPSMPLFLAPEQYLNVPLEPTYLAAYEGVPRFYRNMLER